MSPPKNFRISGPQNAQNQTTKGFSYSRQLRISVGRANVGEAGFVSGLHIFSTLGLLDKMWCHPPNPPTPNESFKPLSGTVRKGAVRGVVGGIAGVEEHLVTDPFLGIFAGGYLDRGKKLRCFLCWYGRGGKISMIIGKKCNGSFEKTRQWQPRTGGVFGGRSTGWSVARWRLKYQPQPLRTLRCQQKPSGNPKEDHLFHQCPNVPVNPKKRNPHLWTTYLILVEMYPPHMGHVAKQGSETVFKDEKL